MTRNKLLIAALALGVACGLAGTVGVLPAVGQSSPPSPSVILGSTARILYRGAVARTVAHVVCQPGDFAQLSVSLTERSGSGIASGVGYVESVSCTGQIQTITVPVTALGKRFVKGTAFGQASLFDCGDIFCGEANDSHSVELKTRHK